MCIVIRDNINKNIIWGMKKIKVLDTNSVIPDIIIPTAEYVGILFFLY